MRLLIFGLIALATLVCAKPSFAQDDLALERTGLFARNRNVTVRERPHPDFAAAPIPLGAFLVTPLLTGDSVYSDNIYAAAAHTASDEAIRLQPNLQIRSDWSRHLISAFGNTEIDKYFRHPGENTVDWSFGTLDRLDIARDLGVAAGLSLGRQTEPRGLESSPVNVRHPIRYRAADAFMEGTKIFNRLRLTARGDYQDFAFDNGVDFSGDPIYQRDRDRGIASAALRAEYALNPDTSLFVNTLADIRRFRNVLPGEALRNSTGYSANFGTSFELTHLLRGEIFAGYIDQHYDSAGYGSVSGPSFGVSANYFITQLMTVTVTASRSVQDAVVKGVGGYLASDFSVQLDHELLRNLILTVNVTGEIDGYRGVDRADTRLSESVSANYQMNRHLGLKISYDHFEQSSTGTARGNVFTVNRLLATLVYQL